MDTDGVVFDALATGRELREAGVENRQAEAIAAAMRRAAAAGRARSMENAMPGGGAVRDSRAGLATGADIATAFAGLESRLRAALHRALLVQGAAIVGALAALKIFG